MRYAFFSWIAPFCVFPYLQQIVFQFVRFEKLISNCQKTPSDLQRLGLLKYNKQFPCYWKQFWKDFFGINSVIGLGLVSLMWLFLGGYFGFFFVSFFLSVFCCCYWFGFWWCCCVVGLFVCFCLVCFCIFCFYIYFFLSRFISKLFLKVHLAQTHYTTKYLKFVKRTFQETADTQNKTKRYWNIHHVLPEISCE